MSSKKAKPKRHPLTCGPCPHKFNEDGCPFWLRAELGVVETKPDGETRVFSGCQFYDGLLVRWLSHVIAAANRPAAAVESMRNEVAEGFEKMAGAFGVAIPELIALAGKNAEMRLIEAKRENGDAGAAG